MGTRPDPGAIQASSFCFVSQQAEMNRNKMTKQVER